MANLSEDIQCAGPIPDHLYLIGLTLHHGPFQMGTYRETLAEGNEGALHLGPERARVYSDLSLEDKDSSRRQGFVQNVQGAGAAGYEGAQNRVENANSGQARQIKCYNCNG
ncbi:hypothetical protein Tco_1333715, partial [Tanacetum coccineum]